MASARTPRPPVPDARGEKGISVRRVRPISRSHRGTGNRSLFRCRRNLQASRVMKAILDHVGIAVGQLHEALAFYRDVLGLEIEAPEDVPSQRVRAHFIPVGESTLELLEATAGDSPIAKFVAKRGPGLHHVCLRVDDIVAALAELKQRGVRLIDETPRPGAHDSLVAFLHPASTHGVLVELKESHGRTRTNTD